MNILDYKDDINRVLLNVGRLGIPPFVDLEKIAEDVPGTGAGYALPSREKFPINSKANTWLSVYYFEKTAEGLSSDERSEAYQRLLDASSAWNVRKPKEWTGHISKEAGDDKGLWVIKNEMTKFAENYQHVDFMQRRTIAKTIVKEAGVFDLDIPNIKIINYASDIPADDMGVRLEPRKQYLSSDDKNKLDLIANMKNKVSIEALISALADLDSRFGLEKLYDHAIKDPVLTLTQATKSTEDPSLITIGGLTVRPDDLAGIIDPDMLQSIKVDPAAALAKNPTLLEVIKKETERGPNS